MEPKFSIEPTAMESLDGLPLVKDRSEFLGDAADTEVGSHVISLEKALELAVKHNRTYQNQRESLYLQALSLTLDRHRYTPIFSGGATGAYERSTHDIQALSPTAQAFSQAPDMMRQIATLTGTPAALLDAYANLIDQYSTATGATATHTEVVDDRDVRGQTNVGVDVLLQGGGRLAVDLTSNFLRFLTGDPNVSTSSALVGTFTQPLMRGAGRKVAAERLTQAERDLLYALRDFTRFRQEFSVQVCSEYYGVLQARESAHNDYRSYQSFVGSVERERAFAEESKRTQAAVGRLEQARLSAESNWTSSARRYRQTLDQFKIRLGLAADTKIVLDDAEMASLKQRGIMHPKIIVDDAVKVAMATRLDLYTARDRVEDAKRKVEVAENALKPGLDLVIQGRVPSKPGDKFQEFDLERSKASAGLNLDAPFDRKSERNAYRAALITEERAARDCDLAEENVKLAVRDGWRGLEQARQAYEIALAKLELNKRRVEEQNLLAELGRATAQDQVDTQNDLTGSENSLVAALVAHTIARLDFWRDLGILYIKEDGHWEEVTDVPQS